MKLKSLKLTNFKGIREFSMEPDGKDVSVYAANKLGKTTIADSLPWLFYDLDSKGKTFNPKPLDLTGEAAHGVASIVEATFIFDDDVIDDLTLKKSFSEDWVLKHGTGKKVFTGHTTQYYIDDMEVSVRKKDYDARLAQIAGSTILKLLTNTRFFAEGEQKTKLKDDPNRWDWEKRRELLFDISDDMPTDEDIIASNKTLSGLAAILDGKSFEGRKAVIKERQKGLNKAINEIPTRIDEKERDLPDVSGLDLSVIEKDLADLSKALTEKNEEAARIEAGGEIAEKVKKQREIEGQLLEIENETSGKRHQAEEEQRKKTSDLEVALRDERTTHDITLKAIKNRETINKAAEQEIVKLRESWEIVNKTVFNGNKTICPTCGQNYPEDQAEKIRKAFNIEKAGRLAGINGHGKSIAIEITARKEQNETDQVEADNYQKKIEELTKQIDELKTQFPAPVKEPKEREALALDLTELKLTINGLRANSQEAIKKVQVEIFAISEKRTEASLKIQTIEARQRGLVRIEELGDQQKAYAAEYENLEEHLFVLNEFTKTKAAMVEGKISEKFTITNFKLFNIQVNGMVDDCCEVVGDGICWNNGLNFSSKTQIGIDAINTLSKHFNLTMPLFIDSCESITKLIPSDSQIIRLVVDEKYKELTVK